VLVKGPAIARLYPERGLRPFGDLDLCVRPDQHGTASEIVVGCAGEFSPIDLHAGCAELPARSWDDVYGRALVVTFGAIDVRVMAPEDHLHFLCLHLLRHGIQTPLWLCDVAVAVESRSQTFDWDLALGPDRRRATGLPNDRPGAPTAGMRPRHARGARAVAWSGWCRAY
jgi:hypothetical protein